MFKVPSAHTYYAQSVTTVKVTIYSKKRKKRRKEKEKKKKKIKRTPFHLKKLQ